MNHDTDAPAHEADWSTYVEDVTGADPTPVTAPIAVHVTNDIRTSEFPARTLVTGQTETLVALRPAQIVPENRQRLSLTLVYRGATGSKAYVQGNPGITTGSAFQLDPGQSLNVQANGAVYGMSDTAGGRFDWLIQSKDG